MAAHRKSDQRRDDPLRGPDFINVHGSGWLQRLVRCFWWHNARRRENEAKHTADRQPPNCHAAEAECRIIPLREAQLLSHLGKPPSLYRTAQAQRAQHGSRMRQRWVRHARSSASLADTWPDQWSRRRDAQPRNAPSRIHELRLVRRIASELLVIRRCSCALTSN